MVQLPGGDQSSKQPQDSQLTAHRIVADVSQTTAAARVAEAAQRAAGVAGNQPFAMQANTQSARSVLNASDYAERPIGKHPAPSVIEMLTSSPLPGAIQRLAQLRRGLEGE